jgi:predicted protein tyrosine phosphatase
MHLLFVCTQNRLRSPTAEQVFSQWPGIECASAGVHSSADVPLDAELIQWADIIFVMESVHKTKMSAKFKKYLDGKRVVCLGIPDDYAFMESALVEILERKVGPFLKNEPYSKAALHAKVLAAHAGKRG